MPMAVRDVPIVLLKAPITIRRYEQLGMTGTLKITVCSFVYITVK